MLATILYWLDDILLHHLTFTGLLKAIGELFKLCADRNIKYPSKSVQCATQTRWCGCLVSAAGTRYDSKRLDGVLKMKLPTIGEHFQQFLCALPRLKNGIPQFFDIVKQLQDFMKLIYARAGKTTKRSVSGLQLTLYSWGTKEMDAFEACKTSLVHQVNLSHRDDKKRLCVYTNASDTVWSGIVTQVLQEDLSKKHLNQHREPLGFLSGRFNGVH